ncbi:MAG: V-type ATPase subunit [Oscillospiraceae bacterium]
MQVLHKQQINRQEFVNATARLRYLEMQLLTGEQTLQLLHTTSREEQLEILAAAGYTRLEEGLLHAVGFNELLYRALAGFCAEAGEISPYGKGYLNLFLLHYDLHNITATDNSVWTGPPRHVAEEEAPLPEAQEPVPHLLPIPAERAALYELMRRGVEAEVPPREEFFAGLYRGAMELRLEKGRKAAQEYMDRRYFATLTEWSGQWGVPLFAQLVAVKIDFYNILSALRLRRIHEMNESYKTKEAQEILENRVLVPGGLAPQEEVLAFYRQPVTLLPGLLAAQPYMSFLQTGLEAFARTGKLHLLEKNMDDYTMQMLQAKRDIPYGPEPFIGYLYARQTEVNNLKLIFTAWSTALGNETAEERLRNTYV